MAISVLPPTATSGSSLKQYQLQFTQENGWAPSTFTVNATWQSVVYGAGLHVAVTNSTTNIVNTSPDGLTWTARTLPGASTNWAGLSYGGGYFVLTNTTSRSAYSSDGINWTTGGSLPSSSSWTVAAYGNGAWVACSSTAAVGAYSVDHGITWVATTQTATYVAISYGAGLFVGIVAGTGGNFATSPDGLAWTDRNSPNLGLDTRDLTWSGTQFVGPAFNSTSIVRSTDGITWTRQLNAMPYGGAWTAIEWGGGRFVAVNTGVSAYSLDGTTWVAGPLMGGSQWQALSYGGGRWVAVPPNGQVANSLLPSNAWTCPAGVTSIDCLLIGAGGAGGGANSTASAGGGGAGQYTRRQLTLTPGTTYTVIIGTGGYPQGGSVGVNGMDSSFGNLLTATGGGGGGAPGSAGAAGASGGGGGATGTGAGAGGGGGAGGPGTNIAFSNTNPTVAGAGGTASAGSSGSFGAAVNSISGSGGAGINGMAGGGGGGANTSGLVGGGSSGGGRGGVATSGVSGLPNTGGGGGGGGTGSGLNVGGNGGSGYCLITWWA